MVHTPATATEGSPPHDKNHPFRRSLDVSEYLIRGLLLACALMSTGITLGIVAFSVRESVGFFSSPAFDIGGFFTGTIWQPSIGQFGILPLLNATILTILIALVWAVPVGLAMAIYLAHYAKESFRAVVKPTLEILAGIPAITYGYFALLFVTPLVRTALGQDTVEVYNLFSASVVTGLLILPTIVTLSEDALSAVPRHLTEAPYGVGATKLETIFKAVLPAAISGLVAALITAASRGMGESMIAALAAGQGNQLTFNPFKAAETIPSYILRISLGQIRFDSIEYNGIFVLGLVVLVITLVFNTVSRYVADRHRWIYD